MHYLTRTLVAQRYNVCVKTISRWQARPELGFPAPRLINKRYYWSEESLAEWEASGGPTLDLSQWNAITTEAA
jgi:hypothetical protein